MQHESVRIDDDVKVCSVHLTAPGAAAAPPRLTLGFEGSCDFTNGGMNSQGLMKSHLPMNSHPCTWRV